MSRSRFAFGGRMPDPGAVHDGWARARRTVLLTGVALPALFFCVLHVVSPAVNLAPWGLSTRRSLTDLVAREAFTPGEQDGAEISPPQGRANMPL